MTDRPKRIVIPVVAGLGNALMAIPMVRQIKNAFPDCAIAILTRSDSMAEPFRRMPQVDESLVIGGGISGALRIIRWTRSRRPDVFLVPFPSNRWQYSLLALASGAKKKILHSYPIGYFRALGFIGQRIPAQRGIHDVIQNLRLLRLLGIEPDETEVPQFPVNQVDRMAAARLMENAGVPKGVQYIVIHAGSASDTVLARAKRWPPRMYAQLIADIREQFARPVVIIEGPDESGVAGEIVANLETISPGRTSQVHIVKLSGPLGQAAAVLERAILYVGSDSGLAHLAAAVGKRAVTLFAPSDPDRVCPTGSRDLVVQTPNLCAPCFTYPFKTPYTSCACKEPFCIAAVTVDKVLAMVTRACQT